MIVALEDLAPNKILVEIEHSGINPVYKAKIFSTTVGFRARIESKMKSDGVINVSMPGIPTDIPFPIILKALGLEEDIKIVNSVSPLKSIQKELDSSLEKLIGIITIKDALLYLGNRLAPGQVEEYRIKKAENILDRNFLPHLGRKPENRKDKINFLAEIAKRIIELKLGLRTEDDKDHYCNKRIRLAGSLLADAAPDAINQTVTAAASQPAYVLIGFIVLTIVLLIFVIYFYKKSKLGNSLKKK